MISQSQANIAVQNVKDFHEAARRNGLRVPALKSRLCTRDFLQGVRAREIWTPTDQSIVVRQCPRPPSVQIIQMELVRSVEAYVHQVDPSLQPSLLALKSHVEKRPGDKAYMLDCIATLYRGDHPYFKKDYLPPKKENFQYQVDNSDDFFSDLPPSQSKGKREALRLLVSKNTYTQLRVAEMDYRMAKMAERK